MVNNFVGEYLVLQGVARRTFTWTVFAALGVILSACYMLWLYRRAFFGKACESVSHHMYFDLTPREWAAIIPLLDPDGLDGDTFTRKASIAPPISAQNARIPHGYNSWSQIKGGTRATSGTGGVPCPIVCSPQAAIECLRILPEIILTIVGTLIMFLRSDPRWTARRVYF